MWRGSWAGGRGSWAAVAGSGRPAGGGYPADRAPGSGARVGRQDRADRRRIVGQAHRIASPWSTDADQAHRMPTRRTGCRPGAPDRASRQTGKGPRPIGSNRGFRLFASAPRRPAPGLAVPGARAMFLANIYLFFRIGFNCLIFAVKIAYITCYVPRETSKTAYQKLAGAPDECSAKCGVRREKTEA